MRRTLRKAANRLAADGRTRSATVHHGRRGDPAPCCRSWSRCTGSGTTCTAASATSTTPCDTDLAAPGPAPHRRRRRSSSRSWRSTASSRPTRWASTTDPSTGCSRAGSSPAGPATRRAGCWRPLVVERALADGARHDVRLDDRGGAGEPAGPQRRRPDGARAARLTGSRDDRPREQEDEDRAGALSARSSPALLPAALPCRLPLPALLPPAPAACFFFFFACRL